ncbi:hypothetical protein [Gordonia alkaliphila]|uniref:hypothetical protein n=1 Tax=Gordonia alkaliphila TaxID=1053547 RepID=UPI0031F1B9B5
MTTGKAVASTTKFEQTLQASTQLPGVRIDRNAFLKAELQRFCTPEQIACAIASTPAEAGIPLSVIDEVAKSVINYETAKVTTISAAAGLPGGFTAIATVPADIAQYYGHVLRGWCRSSPTCTAGPTCSTRTVRDSMQRLRACSLCSLA